MCLSYVQPKIDDRTSLDLILTHQNANGIDPRIPKVICFHVNWYTVSDDSVSIRHSTGDQFIYNVVARCFYTQFDTYMWYLNSM